ncbi:MAG: hypothetical protein M3Y17_13385 [Actinomycetota bacterium]|nr:hypothetical protein [Actinomycetota bacterium]
MRTRALDRSFDELYRHVGLLAAGAPHAGDAEEVGVGAAVALGQPIGGQGGPIELDEAVLEPPGAVLAGGG